MESSLDIICSTAPGQLRVRGTAYTLRGVVEDRAASDAVGIVYLAPWTTAPGLVPDMVVVEAHHLVADRCTLTVRAIYGDSGRAIVAGPLHSLTNIHDLQARLDALGVGR